MKLIAHRRNTLEELLATPRSCGVEVDIRSRGNALIAQHEPYVPGTDFQRWLEAFDHKTLILNVKEEGLEEQLLQLMDERGVQDFFFLDQSFPHLVKWARSGEDRSAVRVSEYESIDTALALTGFCRWIWVDCFSKFPLIREDIDRLKEADFMLCLASPELHGGDAHRLIPAMRADLARVGVQVDAVCSKLPHLWQESID